MSFLLKDFDELKRAIKTDSKGKVLLKEFRKKLKRTEKHSDKLGKYLDDSLNSGEMSDRLAKRLGLL